MGNKIILKNKKAYYEYSIISEFCAGIVLHGPEVKSIRALNVSIKESYCQFAGHELFIKSMNISSYKQVSYNDSDSLRDRKLLLTKQELKKLQKIIETKGLTIIPLELFISEAGFIKLRIAACKGKKFYDKKNVIKERDLNRDLKNNL